MSPARGARPPRRLSFGLILALYMVAAALLPLAHHDIACHLTSATHCTTCVIGSSVESAAEPAWLSWFSMHDTGRATPIPLIGHDALATSGDADRAPPVRP